jgi:hypothetical protein
MQPNMNRPAAPITKGLPDSTKGPSDLFGPLAPLNRPKPVSSDGIPGFVKPAGGMSATPPGHDPLRTLPEQAHNVVPPGFTPQTVGVGNLPATLTNPTLGTQRGKYGKKGKGRKSSPKQRKSPVFYGL